ncbi:MAG: type IV pilin [Euryarchaeota archaeon]|nr:type IV pilin [Euryarchaeota archaeon]MDE1836153.1 type IV pilin [Euryarchaeota archaeon]MDE1882188.1 type IV pilin [Euryarchaeota archaeon]MDE2044131.1 type IV pilin [Thermoplasmata archaeon]
MKRLSKTRAKELDERGVSPIIATILLVAITVVLAAVLYILVGSLGGCGASCREPVAVSMTPGQGGACDGAALYAITIGSASSALTTSGFGVSLQSSGQATATAPGSAGAPSTTKCGVAPPASGWIALLVAPGGTAQQAYYDSAGWHQWNATVFPVPVEGGQSLVIVASSGVNLVQATVSLFATNGGPTVTGQATL